MVCDKVSCNAETSLQYEFWYGTVKTRIKLISFHCRNLHHDNVVCVTRQPFSWLPMSIATSFLVSFSGPSESTTSFWWTVFLRVLDEQSSCQGVTMVIVKGYARTRQKHIQWSL